MKLIFLGPPGAGKGTVSVKAAMTFGVPHISTGDIFRDAIRHGTELGHAVKDLIDSGRLVPDDLTVGLVRERLDEIDASRGWMLDGFPRTIAQAEALDAFRPEDRVIDFAIDDEVVIARLSGRRVCPRCGASFNVISMPPKEEGRCDACGGRLETRVDDREESVRCRIDVYRERTAPLIGYYERKGTLVRVDADRPAPLVLADVLALAGEL
jgi:adenylate kinase